MSASARRRRPFLQEASPLCFAHRGGAALWPENTLVAFRGAMDAGIRYIETDVHATRDGVLVLHHDDRVDRATNGRGAIRDFRLVELKQLDAGYQFSPDGRAHPFRGRGVTIPTLEEAFDLSPELKFNVEIKQRHPDIVRPLWRFIEERELESRILVAAAHDRLVQRFRKISGGRVATSAGRNEVLRFWLAVRAHADRLVPIRYDALQVPLRSGSLTVVDRRFVRAAHRRGVQVHVWTIDHASEMRRLIDLGVDGLMSDRPDRLVQVVHGRSAVAREAPSATAQ